jgi:hypothetical protein
VDVELWGVSDRNGKFEIGQTSLLVTEIARGHLTEWWPLLYKTHSVVGNVLLTFDFFSCGRRKNSENSILAMFNSVSSNASLEDEFDAQIAAL